MLALIGAGRSNTEIAAELVISMATVKTTSGTFSPSSACATTQAVVAARDAGFA